MGKPRLWKPRPLVIVTHDMLGKQPEQLLWITGWKASLLIWLFKLAARLERGLASASCAASRRARRKDRL
jgi:hypothetical protein